MFHARMDDTNIDVHEICN